MPRTIAQELNLKPADLEKRGIFNSFLDIDTRLFIRPELLKTTKIPELKDSHQKIRDHFTKIIKLLISSDTKGDVFWRAADNLFKFNEMSGLCTGYSAKGTSGSGIGKELRERILDTAHQIIKKGIQESEIFLLVGIFEDDVACDRIGDMIGRIIYDDLVQFTARMVKELKIPAEKLITLPKSSLQLPRNPFNNKPMIFLPMDIMDTLPEALSREDISQVCAKNDEVRQELNKFIGTNWADEIEKMKKEKLKDLLLKKPIILKELVKFYKSKHYAPYDFKTDPAGEVTWYEKGLEYAQQHPLKLVLPKNPTIDDVERIAGEICLKFKEMVENNGIWKSLYVGTKQLPELYAQRIFFVIALQYCEMNNIDVTPEANSGRGPVDFKFSHGNKAKVLVELKLSSNTSLVKGYTKQLPAYQDAEKARKGFYLVVDVGRSDRNIKNLYKEKNIHTGKNLKIPEIILVDGRRKKSASKL